MRLAATLLITAALAAAAPGADAAPIFRWTDARGVVHFSNRPETVPAFATEVELPPVAAPVTPPRGAESLTPSAPAPAVPHRDECGAPDVRGLADAVASRLGASGHLDGLTLLVGGVPVAYAPATVTTFRFTDQANGLAASLEQAAIAYPTGATCPSRPPLARYAIPPGQRAVSRGLCDDFQHAFAEVGVAVSRDQGVARSFRAVAERFVRARERGAVVEGPGGALETPRTPLVPAAYAVGGRQLVLPPWVVEAHVAQADELADEAANLVEELTVALEEIDRAARASGCW